MNVLFKKIIKNTTYKCLITRNIQNISINNYHYTAYTVNIKLYRKYISKLFKYPSFSFSNEGRLQGEIDKPDYSLSNDINIAKKQVFWRVRNIGQKELELLIGDWWEKYNNTLSLQEIKDFSKEILEMDNPTMNKYFVKLEDPSNQLIYTRKILNMTK